MPRIDFANLRVAITGATSGIGAATAKALAARGASVGISGRRLDRLSGITKELHSLGAGHVVQTRCDVSVWKDVAGFAAACRKGLGDIDVVIANAGFGNIGNTLDLAPWDVEELIRTNFTGAIWTVQAFGPQLEKRRGQAIVVGSIVSKVAVPYSSVYSGSKWALRGWTRGARPELESRGIALTLFNPGFVRTEFFENRRVTPGVRVWNPGRGMMAQQVAERMLRAIRRRPAEVEMSALSRLAIPVYRLMPIQIPRILARSLRKRADSRFLGSEGPAP